MSDQATTDEPTQPNRDGAHNRPGLIVGLGASAGGIAALREFFANLSPDSGHAYVVILHLSPDHESKLAEVLQAVSPVPVALVADAVRMRRNHVYVVSPNQTLTADNGALMATPTRVDQRRAPVDLFFRALADSEGSRAVSVILSGTGSDGASGFKRVKEHGGLTIAQDPASAEFSAMPAAAIATGLVDLVLRPAEMASHIRDYGQRLDETVLHEPTTRGELDLSALREILTLIRIRAGHDFSNYKPATVLRRVARRMNVRQVSTPGEYGLLLREDQDEVAALMKDLLISVTNFFRDADAFRALGQRVIPQLFAGEHPPDQVRLWCAGCATGEEAYSLAMLLVEALSGQVDQPSIQVFATDLDENAIAVGRDGFYTNTEIVDVSDERLERFFKRASGGYRIRRELRESVLFAHHNLIKDPPFSHLDLISCRNVLIYLNRTAQERVLETFHFALRPGRYLMLGTTESPAGADLFLPLDKAAHIFQSRSVAGRLPIPFAEPLTVPLHRPPRAVELGTGERLLPADLHLRLLEQYAPPSIVVTDEHNVLHVTEGAARYLSISAGEPSRDLMHLALPGLRADLRAALHQAARDRIKVDVRRVPVSIDGSDTYIRLQVRPALKDGDPARGFFLILFEEEHGEEGPSAPAVELVNSPASAAVARLDEELSRVKAQLRSTVEQHETQVEEAKASNEELQALNEELRSSAEELETSKEELQSVNEELTTVNEELKIKIEELAHTNNDFINFINSTDIASIFLDRSLKVKLSTPRAADIFNLLPADQGRRLTDITSRLADDAIHKDVQHVLDHLQIAEREVATTDGRWYLMRLLPYRTTDDRIEGIVMTFLDITSRREAEERIRAGEERLRLLIQSAVDYAIFTITADARIDFWNSGAQRMFGYAPEEIVGQNAEILFTPEDRATGVAAAELARAAVDGRAEGERWQVRKDGSRLYCSGVTTRLGDARRFGFAKIARDLTERRDANSALQNARADLEDRVRSRTSELQSRVAEHAAAEEHVTTLLRRVVTAQEDERTRIARDLHDQLGQQLIALRLALERHRDRCSAPEPSDGDLPKAMALAADIDTAIDFLAWELRPALLDDLGLAAALPRFVEEWAKHYGIAAECHTGTFSAGDLPHESEVAFYRVAQEALNNVVKHAHASRVDVLLETRDRTVSLVIEDDGIGFDADGRMSGSGIGLIGMRERASLITASLEIESSPGHGTTVFLRTAAVQ